MANAPFDVTPFLTQVEGQHFDRKSMLEGPPGAKRSRGRRAMREQAAEYVAAFANADGGVLLLGVEDDGSVTGHRLLPEAVDALLAAPQTRLDPPQPPGFTVLHDGVELIVFDVQVEDVPVQLTGNGFRALLMAHRRGHVRNAALCAVTGLDTLRASHLLRGLRDRELLTLHPRGGESFYTLTPAVREHVSESLPGADRGELWDGSGGAAAADRGELPADRGELPADRGELSADRGELPADRGELPAHVQRAIEGLGSRPRKERLRSVIESICAAREWSTPGEIARFLRFSQRNLGSRHLTPMVKAGRLVQRYPDSPTHPKQAYRADSPEGSSEGEHS